MTSMTLEGRNLSLNDAMELLTTQAAHKVDVVLPYSALKAEDGTIKIDGVEVVIGEDGVTDPNGFYTPTIVGNESIASRLDIPTPYMRRMRGDDHAHITLWDQNVNHWLRMQANKKALVRLFTPANAAEFGVFRSMSSDRFKRLDNLDTVLAILDGLRQAGIEFSIGGFDISERRLRLTVEAPAIKVAATTLLKGYRSPFTGGSAADRPFIHAGFAFSNSETGNGSLSLGPRAVVEVCSNGMTRNIDLFRAVHLGGKMDEGVVQWAEDTQEKSLRLVTAQVRDTVKAFCSEDYLAEWVAELEEKSATPVTNPEKAIKVIARRAGFSQTEAQGILAHFISGGQPTAGGFMQATTSFSQTIKSPERAIEVEESGEKVLGIAASLSA
jgi:hypothetical protein